MPTVKQRYPEFKTTKKTKSVTEVIDSLSEDFKESFVHQNADEETKKQWELMGDIGKDGGNTLHQILELWIKYGAEPKNKLWLHFSKQFQEMFPNRENYISEEKIYDSENDIIGTLDLQELGKEIVISDLKTYHNLYENIGNKYLKPPFQHYKATNYNKTLIQLAHYKRLVESTGKKVSSTAWILYLDEFIIKKVKVEIPEELL